MLRAALAGFILLLTSVAHAQAPPKTEENSPVRPVAVLPKTPPPSAEYLDYRGYLALSDVASVVLLVAAAKANAPGSGVLALGGVGVYALGGPTVHMLSDQPGRAAGSLALRLGLPLVLGASGFALGAAGCRSGSSTDGAGEYDDTAGLACGLSEYGLGALGVLTGMLTAALIDDIALGRVKLDPPSAPPARRAAVGVAPFMAQRGQGGGVMLLGTF